MTNDESPIVAEIELDRDKLLGFRHLPKASDVDSARTAATAIFNKIGGEGPAAPSK